MHNGIEHSEHESISTASGSPHSLPSQSLPISHNDDPQGVKEVVPEVVYTKRKRKRRKGHGWSRSKKSSTNLKLLFKSKSNHQTHLKSSRQSPPKSIHQSRSKWTRQSRSKSTNRSRSNSSHRSLTKSTHRSRSKLRRRSPPKSTHQSCSKSTHRSHSQSTQRPHFKSSHRSLSESTYHSPLKSIRRSRSKSTHRSPSESTHRSRSKSTQRPHFKSSHRSLSESTHHSPPKSIRRSRSKSAHRSPSESTHRSRSKSTQRSHSNSSHRSLSESSRHSPPKSIRRSRSKSTHRSPSESNHRSRSKSNHRSPSESNHHSPQNSTRRSRSKSTYRSLSKSSRRSCSASPTRAYSRNTCTTAISGLTDLTTEVSDSEGLLTITGVRSDDEVRSITSRRRRKRRGHGWTKRKRSQSYRSRSPRSVYSRTSRGGISNRSHNPTRIKKLVQGGRAEGLRLKNIFCDILAEKSHLQEFIIAYLIEQKMCYEFYKEIDKSEMMPIVKTRHASRIRDQVVKAFQRSVFECPDCYMCSFSNDCHELTKHIVDVHKRMTLYICYECRSKFAVKQHLDVHKEEKHNRWFQAYCLYCSEEFHHRKLYEDHMNLYLTDAYSCVYCGKLYLDKLSYRRHVRVRHDGLKFYVQPQSRIIDRIDYDKPERLCYNQINDSFVRILIQEPSDESTNCEPVPLELCETLPYWERRFLVQNLALQRNNHDSIRIA